MSSGTTLPDPEWKKYLEAARHFCNGSELPELAFSEYEWSFIEHATHEFCHVASLGLEPNDLLDGAEVSWKVNRKIQKFDDVAERLSILGEPDEDDILGRSIEEEISALATEMIVLRDLGIPIKKDEIIEAAMEQSVPEKCIREALLCPEDYRQTADEVLGMLEELRRKYLDYQAHKS